MIIVAARDDTERARVLAALHAYAAHTDDGASPVQLQPLILAPLNSPSQAVLDASTSGTTVDASKPPLHPALAHPHSIAPFAPLTHSQLVALSSLSANASGPVILLYSPASRASFDALPMLWSRIQPVLDSRIGVHLLAVGLEGEAVVVSSAEGAAWAARMERNSFPHRSFTFSPLVVCKQRWEEALHQLARSERKQRSRWWQRLLHRRALSPLLLPVLSDDPSADFSTHAAAAPACAGSHSPMAYWPPGEVRAIEDPTPQPEPDSPSPSSSVVSVSDRASSVESGDGASVAPLMQSPDMTEEEVLEAAAASGCSISLASLSNLSAATCAQQSLPRPSPTSDEVASLLVTLDASLDPSLSPPAVFLDCVPRALSSTLQVDVSALVSPAPFKAAQGACVSPFSASSAGGSTALKPGHSPRAMSMGYVQQHLPGATAVTSTASTCSTASTTPQHLRSRNNSHACAMHMLAHAQHGASIGALHCHASTVAACAVAGGGSSNSSTATHSPTASFGCTPRAWPAVAPAASSVASLSSTAPAAMATVAERPKKLIARAWSDSDKELLEALTMLTPTPQPEAHSLSLSVSSGSNGNIVMLDGSAACAVSGPISPAGSVCSTSSLGSTSTPTFQHHPTQSPFARFGESSAGASHTITPSTRHSPLPHFPPPAPEEILAPHALGSASCTCAGSVAFMIEHVKAKHTAGAWIGAAPGVDATLAAPSTHPRWHSPSASSHSAHASHAHVGGRCSHPHSYGGAHDGVHAQMPFGLCAGVIVLLMLALLLNSILLQARESARHSDAGASPFAPLAHAGQAQQPQVMEMCAASTADL